MLNYLTGIKYITLVVLTVSGYNAFSQKLPDTVQARIHSGYQFIYDSLHKKVNLGWLTEEATVMDDSLFMPADSTDYFRDSLYLDSNGSLRTIKVLIYGYYPSFGNHIYQSVGSELAGEFIAFNQKLRVTGWDVSKFAKQVPGSTDSMKCGNFWCKAWVKQPVFNADGSKMIIEAGNTCGGLCGYGFIALYELKERGWIEVVKFIEWVN